MKPKLLLHVCCAPCAGHLLEKLQKEFDLTAYFYNPNLDSKEEHQKRLVEVEKYCKKLGIDLIRGDYNHKEWLGIVKGLESESEGRKRCLKCFEMRLKEVAKFAKEHNFDCFSTTLTTSPYKSAKVISPIGREVARKFGVKFLDKDFGRRDGFKKSLGICKEEEFYRQDYCGCEFSKAGDRG